eukprot:COSAG06_NODE_440_length_15762_cov_75.979825_15_plen_135_part_00
MERKNTLQLFFFKTKSKESHVAQNRECNNQNILQEKHCLSAYTLSLARLTSGRSHAQREEPKEEDAKAFIRPVSAQHAQLHAHSTVHNAAVAAGQLVHQPVRVVHVAHAWQNLGVECPLRACRVRRAEVAALRD